MPKVWEDLFDELAELGPAERDVRLLAISVDDPALAAQLRRLLAADAADLTLAEPILARAPEMVAQALITPVRSTTVGPYRLIELLGEGGMGEVFRAERCDGEYEHHVALKRIRSLEASAALSERFLRERQILARLQHPGIARLLDGGRDSEGRPYFVLELVEGEPITSWCERTGAPIEVRLRLLAEVADAVDAAHRRLVVHRDLKPSNILVDREGRPRLLDFGIAAILEQEGDVALTQHNQHPFTPAYAAPEQILGEPITTATDVWALGALLFELLTGRLPFPSRKRNLADLVRTVTTEVAERPSTVAAAADTNDLRDRARRLTGDLDAIVLTALAREPNRRYRSAAAFAEDLRRHLDNLPVVARAPSLRYRTRKLVARHRLAVAAVLLVAASLVIGLGAALWQARAAGLEARRAETVTSLLVDLFRASDPSLSLGADISARELLEQGADRVVAGLDSEPGVHARVLDAIAQAERGLGAAPQAEEHARAALAALAGDAEASAAVRVTLAEVLISRGQLADATTQLRLAADSWPAVKEFVAGGGVQPLARRWTDARIQAAWGQHDLDTALRLSTKSLSQLLAADADPIEIAMRRVAQAAVLSDAGRPREAEPVLRAALPNLGKDGNDPLALAAARFQAGELLGLLGDRVEADRWTRLGLDQLARALGPDHPEIALHEISLGFQLNERRQLDEADRVLRHAIAVLTPLDHPELGAAIRYLGFVDLNRGDAALAAERFRAAEASFARFPEQAHLAVAARLSLGWVHIELGEAAKAVELLEPVLEAFEQLEGPDGANVRAALKYLGHARRDLGEPAAALADHQRALAIERVLYGGEERTAVATTKSHLALDHLALDNISDARRFADEAVATARTLDPTSTRLADCLAASAAVALAELDSGRARRELEEALQLRTSLDGANHPKTVRLRDRLDALDRPQ